MLDSYIIKPQVDSPSWVSMYLTEPHTFLLQLYILIITGFNTMPDGNFDSDYFQHTEETDAFRQEYEMRKMKQVM